MMRRRGDLGNVAAIYTKRSAHKVKEGYFFMYLF